MKTSWKVSEVHLGLDSAIESRGNKLPNGRRTLTLSSLIEASEELLTGDSLSTGSRMIVSTVSRVYHLFLKFAAVWSPEAPLD